MAPATEGPSANIDAAPIVAGLQRQIGDLALRIAVLESQLEQTTRERDEYQRQTTQMAILARRVEELEREELQDVQESERVASAGNGTATSGNHSKGTVAKP
jgi:hypothetical protein